MVLSAVAGLSLMVASPAWAHPDVDRGRALYEGADLDGALEAFERAEASSDLTGEDLARLLETRVLVHMALGDEEAANRDLGRLGSFAPDHRFGADVPPDVVTRFERIRDESDGPLRLVVDAAPSSGEAVLTVRVEDDTYDLVREVTVHHRPLGEPYEQSNDARVVVPLEDGGVEYWAEARGPGGAVVATHGSALSPRRLGPPGAVDAATQGGQTEPWLWVGGGALAAAVVVVVIAVAVSSDGGPSVQTQPTRPMVEF